MPDQSSALYKSRKVQWEILLRKWKKTVTWACSIRRWNKTDWGLHIQSPGSISHTGSNHFHLAGTRLLSPVTGSMKSGWETQLSLIDWNYASVTRGKVQLCQKASVPGGPWTPPGSQCRETEVHIHALRSCCFAGGKGILGAWVTVLCSQAGTAERSPFPAKKPGSIWKTLSLHKGLFQIGTYLYHKESSICLHLSLSQSCPLQLFSWKPNF